MKSVTFHIDHQVITYQVNWLGFETIKVNGNVVSKKLSLPKRKHPFTLEIEGQHHEFVVTSKQQFNSGYIRVFLLKGDMVIEEKCIDFSIAVSEDTAKSGDNSTFVIGLMLVFLSHIFGWPKFFLIMGWIILFFAFFKKHNASVVSEDHQKPNIN